MIKRREFIAALGSAAVWPVVAGAQQPARWRTQNWCVDERGIIFLCRQ